MRLGGEFSPPKVIYQVDPEFSEEARRAKHYGTVILVVDVDTRGRAVNVRVARSLGLGLDEKAMEAVSRWRFKPGMRSGRPVTVSATIEVNFHLL
jgi:TonB family protein